jgi:hypothetical protein
VLSSLLIACICNYKVKALASQVSASAYGSLVRFCHTGTQMYGGVCGDSMRWSRHEERIYTLANLSRDLGGSYGCLPTPYQQIRLRNVHKPYHHHEGEIRPTPTYFSTPRDAPEQRPQRCRSSASFMASTPSVALYSFQLSVLWPFHFL